ncbi:Auxin-binding protein ABP19a [Bienertia sinuspersici]
MFLLVFFILISHSSANSVFDFCVANLSLPNGPEGYACKDPKRVTADDFVYSGLAIPNNAKNSSSSIPFLQTVETTQFPGLNGMGISIARGQLKVGEIVPIHIHRVCEVLYVIEGTIGAAFIDTNNTAYYKTLNKGEMIVFPPALMHFPFNVGSIPALTYSTFASENPGRQFVNNALFGGKLPSDLVEKITLLDHAQVQKLKKIFGGTN